VAGGASGGADDGDCGAAAAGGAVAGHGADAADEANTSGACGRRKGKRKQKQPPVVPMCADRAACTGGAGCSGHAGGGGVCTGKGHWLVGTAADKKRKSRRKWTKGSTRKKRKKATRREIERDDLPQKPIVVGVDPGRSNIIYAVRWRDGVYDREIKLTRSEYYHLSGVNERKFVMASLGRGLEGYHRMLTQQGSLKCASYLDLVPALVLRAANFWAAWEVYVDNPKRAKLGFKVHCGKLRTLQQKMNEFGRGLTREEKERLVVGYGNGGFPSHGPRGERAVPVRRPRRICGGTWRHTLDVNENYSTATCFDCERPLVDVRTNIPFRTRQGHLRFKDNRGCKRCTSDTCRSAFPFKGRDFNAALNIVRITDCMLQGVPRPRCYTRAHHDEHRRARRGGPAA